MEKSSAIVHLKSLTGLEETVYSVSNLLLGTVFLPEQTVNNLGWEP